MIKTTPKEVTKFIKPVEQKREVRTTESWRLTLQGHSRGQRRILTTTRIAFMSGRCLVTASEFLEGGWYN